jgi:hypothetical protein
MPIIKKNQKKKKKQKNNKLVTKGFLNFYKLFLLKFLFFFFL